MFKTLSAGVAFTQMCLIRKVGAVAGVGGIDFLTPAEIRGQLAKIDPETHKLLEAFIDAFHEWSEIAQMVESHLDEGASMREEHALAFQKRSIRQSELEQRLNMLNARQ